VRLSKPVGASVIAAAGVTEVDSGVTVTVWAATATGSGSASVAALPSEEHAATRKEDGSNNEAEMSRRCAFMTLFSWVLAKTNVPGNSAPVTTSPTSYCRDPLGQRSFQSRVSRLRSLDFLWRRAPYGATSFIVNHIYDR